MTRSERLYRGTVGFHWLNGTDPITVMVSHYCRADPRYQDPVEVEVVAATDSGRLVVKAHIPAKEAATWLAATWPNHFRRDGTCRCGEEVLRRCSDSPRPRARRGAQP